MVSISESQKAELSTLKRRIIQARSLGGRADFPQDLRDRVVGLRRAGIKQSEICAELQLASSVVSDWERKAAGVANTAKAPRPRVLAVQAPQAPQVPQVPQVPHPGASAKQTLSLTLGNFVITIGVT